MPVPDYQSLMLPMLKLAGDGNEHSISESVEKIADRFGLSEATDERRRPGHVSRLSGRANRGIIC